MKDAIVTFALLLPVFIPLFIVTFLTEYSAFRFSYFLTFF